MTTPTSGTPISVIYIHGFGGSNDAGGIADQLARALGGGFALKAPAYDAANPADAMELITNAIREEGLKELVLIGNSLGGFFANYLSQRHGIDTLLINPLLHPCHFLRQQGFSHGIVAQYAALEKASVATGISPRIVLIGDADDVVDPNENGYTLRGLAEIRTIPMGHKLTEIQVAADLIESLSSNLSQMPD